MMSSTRILLHSGLYTLLAETKLNSRFTNRPIYENIAYTADDRVFPNNGSSNPDNAWDRFKKEQGISSKSSKITNHFRILFNSCFHRYGE